MLRNIFLLSEQIIFGNLHTRNIWLLLYLFLNLPKLARLAGERLAMVEV